MKVSFGVFTIFTGSIVWTVPTALVLQKASVATEQARSVVWAKKKSTPDRGDLCPAMCSYADLVLDPLVPKKGGYTPGSLKRNPMSLWHHSPQ